MDATTERRLLGLIGLGIRARNAVVGVEQVRMAAKKGKVAMVFVAPDASPNSRKKLIPLLEASGVFVVQGPGAEALGSVAGRESTAAIGILDYALARGMRKLLDGEKALVSTTDRKDVKGIPARKGLRRIG